MDEETSIIDSNTRNEKIKNFFINNKKTLISSVIIIIILIISFYAFQIYKDDRRKNISNKFNNAVIDYKINNKSEIFKSLKDIVEDKDGTYSPLALYFIIDNNLSKNKNEINYLFDILINETSLEIEIKNLIIYKKALFNADQAGELELINILKPLINSKSIWQSHALFLLGEFFFDKGEIQKSKDFFSQILNVENPNSEILINTQRRLNRDFSD
tara:strand:+ start:795 stop:1439 length:645 start_codon:yes stop_codon:yes gene_type:complete